MPILDINRPREILSSLKTTDVLAILISTYVLVKIGRRLLTTRVKTTKVPGPPRKNWLFGYGLQVMGETYPFDGILLDWAKEYGLVHRIPWLFGEDQLVVLDPKALSHIMTKDTWEYSRSPTGNRVIKTAVRPSFSIPKAYLELIAFLDW